MTRGWLISFLLFTTVTAQAMDAGAALAEMARKAAALEKSNEKVLTGRDQWLFFSGELRSITVGDFWGENAAKVSRAARPTAADPLPAILEFNAQCKAAGVELLLVPVPPKAVIYADRIVTELKPGPDGKLPRLDTHLQAFYALLREKGVQVLDLSDLFLRERDALRDNLYCKHDTHWSSRACRLAAKVIHQQVADREWLKTMRRRGMEIVSSERPLAIKGDLWSYVKDRVAESETIPLIYVGLSRGDDAIPSPLAAERDSPVLLIGDSHTLVFNAGDDLYARGAGLADHMALEFGFPVDLVGVRGAGTTVPRVDLARRKDNLKGKKLVVWCFSARQFTESVNGWMTGVPVVVKDGK